MRIQCETGTRAGTVNRRDSLIGAGITLGAALVVAAIMLIGRGPLTETIGLTMTPGVLGIGVLWTQRSRRSWLQRAALCGGTLLLLFLIGLTAGLAGGA